MSHEASIGQAVEKTQEVNRSSANDNLQSCRTAEKNMPVATTNTSDTYLPALDLIGTGDEKPFNPNNAPGTYDKSDIAFAKQNFNPTEVKQLEMQGPKSFNTAMDEIKAAPVKGIGGAESQADQIDDTKSSLAATHSSFIKHYETH